MEEYRFPSKSSDKVHTTTVFDDGAVKCTCSGYVFNRKCWHVTQVKKDLEAKKQQDLDANFCDKDKNSTVQQDPVGIESSSQTVNQTKEAKMSDKPKSRFQTKHGYDMFLLLSAFHKSCRKGMEYEACHYAIEIASTSKSSFSMIVNYLETMTHEDVGVGDLSVGTYVMTTCRHCREYYDRKRELPDMALCNAIVAICRSRKDHTGVNLALMVQGEQNKFGCVPKIPDCAYDMHTKQGRAMGRGKEHFLTEAYWGMHNEVEEQPWRDQFNEGWVNGWSVDPDDMEKPRSNDSPSLFDQLGEE